MAKYEQDVKWITVRGNHIPIKPGQTVQQAISERFDDTDDIDIDIETNDLDKEIESDTFYYFTGYNPHEVSKEEFEQNSKNQYYLQGAISPETKDLMKEMLTEENVDKYTLGQLCIKFWDKTLYTEHGHALRRAIQSKFRNLALKEYEKKAKRVLNSIPKSSDKSSEYALKQNANGYVESMEAAPRTKERKAYTYNCQRCVIAYEMRRRGYDVEADAFIEGTRLGFNHNNLKQSFLNFDDTKMVHEYDRRPDGELYSGKGPLYRALINDMLKEPDGSRFVLEWDWKCEGAGHTVNAEKINGEIILFDSQNGKQKPLKEYLNYYTNIRPRTINWVRVDELKLSGDLEGVVKWKK